ncbi:uncharacterized protein LOC112684452 [Sipha flava]|uniref:Uncharacterized protein LOC112684452 n=2 Tax=Sipha flava TaxID=143950 RepID=A0A8B8FM99_9HEMI|nr:uncharacterized protein LOC112684452 [Sipha flava]
MSESQTDVSTDDLCEGVETCQHDTDKTKKIINPDDSKMTIFQNALKQHLVKQKYDLKQELFEMEQRIESKKNQKVLLENEKRNIISNRLKAQRDLLIKLNSTKTEIVIIREKIVASINQGKKQCNEITTKISNEMEKISILKRKLGYSQCLLKDLIIYESEQVVHFKKCDFKKSTLKQLKKIYLNNQQQKNLLCSSLTQEIGRLEDQKRQLKQEAETKYNESELLKQKLMDTSTDMDITRRDNAKLTVLWNKVLTNIEQRNENIQRIKIDFQKAKDEHHALLVEANSYESNAQIESTRNIYLHNSSNELKLKQSDLQNSYYTLLDKFNRSKDEYSKLIQITNFEYLNLDQVLLVQDFLSELKIQSNTNSKSIQNSKKISELTIQIKDREEMLLKFEKMFKQAVLQFEQYREISSILKNDIEENTTCLNDQEVILSTLHSELKKLDLDIHNESKSILKKEKIIMITTEKEEAREFYKN